jgi:hypothetical protein
MPSRGNRNLAAVLVVLAVIFLAAAIYYATQTTSLLATENGKHPKHAILSLALAVLSLIAANVFRPRQA